jgi:propanol-preferring alcohol dehydrogenase
MSTNSDQAHQYDDGKMMSVRMFHAHEPLRVAHVPIPVPSEGELLIRVKACGVCRTDLHILDGDLPTLQSPLILGHEVVGEVVTESKFAPQFPKGARVGVPWLGGTCGQCGYCIEKRENLCDKPRFTGYNHDGGYAEFIVANAHYCFRIPDNYDDIHAAPLLCAGLIGYRAYSLIARAKNIGLYGFGAAAHIVAQIAYHQGKRVYAFTRPGDIRSQEFARSLRAFWVGGSDEKPPIELDAAIIFASAGELIPQALSVTRKGATVVCAGIHMSDIPAFPYSRLWGERCVRSVANLTRADGEAFFALAKKIPLHINAVPYAMKNANQALNDLRSGAFDGAAVLVPDWGQDFV